MLDGNISMRQNVKKLIADVFEGGKTVNFAAEALNTIYELEPRAKGLSRDDWKEIELHYQVLLSRICCERSAAKGW
jgi:hypothetical protein